MDLDQALTHVAVLGAAGKMGRGIALLLLQEMAKLELENQGKVGTGTYVLNLIDVNEASFVPLHSYLRDQLFKYAEKNINRLRKGYEHNKELISNEEIIDAFVNGASSLLFFDTEVDAAKNANLIFEAIIEDIETKAKVFQSIAKKGNTKGFFLSNTSSIPIHILDEKAGLNNRIIGYHFYNPPVVQKLLEIIPPSNANQDLFKIANELAIRLGKQIVISKDVAGFIGNGHMIREIAFACKKVAELTEEYSLPEAIYMVNKVTQDWLIRPMGIFQLIDYVGIEVCRYVSHIMSENLHDSSLKFDLLERMFEKGILGGQNPDNKQKNGFFKYENHILAGIYSLDKSRYIPFADAYWILRADHALGELPKGWISWKALQKEIHKEKILEVYFENLFEQHNLGAKIAQDFLKNSHSIVNKLVQDGVASSLGDVDTVLKQGFYHLYGPSEVFKGVKA